MLTPDHARLLRHLCRDVGLVTDDQAVRLAAGDGPPAPGLVRELGGLVARDLLRRERAIARTLPPLTEPLAAWGPGDPPPDMAAVAWRSERRWHLVPRVVTVFRAGPLARRLFGHSTAGGPGNLSALSHDLACAELLLAFARLAPERARDWVGEAVRKPAAGRGQKLPDVVLHAPDGAPYLVCEVVGVYPKARLDAFHAFVAGELDLPYELW